MSVELAPPELVALAEQKKLGQPMKVDAADALKMRANVGRWYVVPITTNKPSYLRSRVFYFRNALPKAHGGKWEVVRVRDKILARVVEVPA